MTYMELLEIIIKPWLTIEDISKVGGCGRCGALLIINDIEERISREGKILPPTRSKIAPTKMVLDVLGIDEEYVYDMAMKEKTMHQGGY